MTQREKIEDMLKTIYYKGKDGKGYSDYEISGDVAQIEDLIIEGQIEELKYCRQAPNQPDIKNDKFYFDIGYRVVERLTTLQASLKGKEV